MLRAGGGINPPLAPGSQQASPCAAPAAASALDWTTADLPCSPFALLCVLVRPVQQLKEKPALVNEAAEEGGWFVKMEVDGKAVEAQLKSMLDKAAYAKHCDDSKH